MYCTATTINCGALHLMMYALPETEMHFACYSAAAAARAELVRARVYVYGVSQVRVRAPLPPTGVTCSIYDRWEIHFIST